MTPPDESTIAIEPQERLYAATVVCACEPEATIHSGYISENALPFYFSCPSCGQRYVVTRPVS